MSSTQFTPADVAHIATLAQIPVTDEEKKTLATGFITTMGVVDQLAQVNVSGVTPTHQVTGLENVMREDVIDEKRMLTQDNALSTAPRSHNGYFVVDRILE